MWQYLSTVCSGSLPGTQTGPVSRPTSLEYVVFERARHSQAAPTRGNVEGVRPERNFPGGAGKVLGCPDGSQPRRGFPPHARGRRALGIVRDGANPTPVDAEIRPITPADFDAARRLSVHAFGFNA